jgi:hypothetical protein
MEVVCRAKVERVHYVAPFAASIIWPVVVTTITTPTVIVATIKTITVVGVTTPAKL